MDRTTGGAPTRPPQGVAGAVLLLGVLLAGIVWFGWFLGMESRRGGRESGVNDEDHGIEL